MSQITSVSDTSTSRHEPLIWRAIERSLNTPVAGAIARGVDHVELSGRAQGVERADRPETRAERIERVKREVAGGTYDVDGKLDLALDRALRSLDVQG